MVRCGGQRHVSRSLEEQTPREIPGGLDTLVNNAGILRDKTLINMSEDEWDAIMKVQLRRSPQSFEALTFSESVFSAENIVGRKSDTNPPRT